MDRLTVYPAPLLPTRHTQSSMAQEQRLRDRRSSGVGPGYLRRSQVTDAIVVVPSNFLVELT
jgi:hypothetical protein